MPLIGEHNFRNYLSAILAAKIEGISIEASLSSLKNFKGVKRRMDLVTESSNICIYDDFAHHPTAIQLSCDAIRNKYHSKKILGIIELGSNTMSSGYHKDNLINAFQALDETLILDSKKKYSYKNVFNSDLDLISYAKEIIFEYDIILIMTNKDSQKFIQPLVNYLEKK